jgi:hypothetical protein
LVELLFVALRPHIAMEALEVVALNVAVYLAVHLRRTIPNAEPSVFAVVAFARSRTRL